MLCNRVRKTLSHWVRIGQAIGSGVNRSVSESVCPNRHPPRAQEAEEAEDGREVRATDLNDESLVSESRRKTNDAHVVSAVDEDFNAVVDTLQCKATNTNVNRTTKTTPVVNHFVKTLDAPQVLYIWSTHTTILQM